jgi:fructokinase
MRIGIDLGGTKTEIVVLDGAGGIVIRRRVATPTGYGEVLAGLAGLVRAAEAEVGAVCTVGVGIPGSISPATGLVKNANSNALNGHRFDQDLAALLGRELSEAAAGAAAGCAIVFGVIIGTGCGGGVVVDGRILEGRHRLAGEFGHTPLPWPRMAEMPLLKCWCGQAGCLEMYVSGPALAASCDGPGARDARSIPGRAAAGEQKAAAALAAHADRLARALAVVTNMIDPDAIVLGGGLSNLPGLAEALPGLMAPYVFSDTCAPNVVRNVHGDSSGVRGAAWLWPG